MHLRVICVIVSLCILPQLGLQINSTFDQSNIDEIIIVRRIVTHFLIKYFSDNQIVVSVIISPSEKATNQFRTDLEYNLFGDLVAAGFSLIALDKLDNASRGNRNSFNLIVVGDIAALQ